MAMMLLSPSYQKLKLWLVLSLKILSVSRWEDNSDAAV